MQATAVFFSHLICRDNFATQVCELNKLLLDCLQAFHPFSVSDLSLGSIHAFTPKLLIQVLDSSDLFSQTSDLVPQHQ